MKRNILKALLLIEGLFILNLPVQASIVFEDKMVFKINTKVFSVNDLKTYHEMVNNLACTYEESLLFKIFKEEFLPSKKSLLKINKNYSAEQKKYCLELM